MEMQYNGSGLQPSCVMPNRSKKNCFALPCHSFVCFSIRVLELVQTPYSPCYVLSFDIGCTVFFVRLLFSVICRFAYEHGTKKQSALLFAVAAAAFSFCRCAPFNNAAALSLVSYFAVQINRFMNAKWKKNGKTTHQKCRQPIYKTTNDDQCFIHMIFSDEILLWLCRCMPLFSYCHYQSKSILDVISLGFVPAAFIK